MKIEIENYRGWDITLCTEKDEFSAYSNRYDSEKVKYGLQNLRDFIDDFIKKNSDFKPVKIEKLPSSYSNGSELTLIGIRKDGRFMAQDPDGKKIQISDYNEKDYIVHNSENEPLKKQLKELNEKRDLLTKEIRKIEHQFKGTPISELRKQYQ